MYLRNKYVKTKTCVKRSLKNMQNKDLNGKWYLKEGRKYCRKLPFCYYSKLVSVKNDKKFDKPLHLII